MGSKVLTLPPSNNKVILERDETTLSEAKNVFRASSDAFPSWRATPFSQRRDILTKALCLIQERKHQLGEELTLQMGRPISFGVKEIEIETMQKRADYLLSIAEESLSPLPGQPEQGFQHWIEKEPFGPTLLVFAWNFPYLIIVNSLLPALLSGNTVVLKPSPQTPLVAERLVEIFTEAGGLPKDVVQVIHTGNAETLRELVRIPDVNEPVRAGEPRGGNDPAYVRTDADLKYVAEQLVDGAVFNAGQSCCAIERIYVHTDVHDEFVAEVQKELAQYKLGDPADKNTNVGPVISRAAQASVNAQIQDALAKGAVNATPSNPTFVNPAAEGNYVIPTVLINLNHDMVVMKEETFGPVIPIMRVSSDEEADPVAGEKLLKVLEAGTVFINRCDYPNPDLAWTGWKNSGTRHTLGPRGFDPFYKLKSYHIREKQGWLFLSISLE
ncbi:hypothetical protein PENFLA_c081G06425 [Penicillium flavigenum]|uniref:aldehyde dehydrogenase (NAD(+)) n=1 Tax=Penicillium flavigenum TaxID=254877 RepID=A0A1V6SA99_9EURO|nr:hypothetical protein PENFLA_c081G06425 [Penicillium flavigenum]